MARAAIVLRQKLIDVDGNIRELVIWEPPATANTPAGIKYRLAFVRRGEAKPVVLYDNHSPKGDHRHIKGIEEPYRFVDVSRLVADFLMDVRRIEEDEEWPRR
jgi:hypothetical protein